MRYLALLAFLLLPSCSLATRMMETTKRVGDGFQILATGIKDLNARVDAGLKKVSADVDGLVAGYEQAKQAADTDGDGETSIPEWLRYALGIVGTGLLGGGGTLLAQATRRRREIEVRNAHSDGRKSRSEARLDALEAKT